MLNRAVRNFRGNWTAIVLAVISIIQGLAFNDLAGRLQDILGYTLKTHDLVLAAHFLLCFVLLLRIFQTYVTAALDYDDWVPRFSDILLIFVIGLIEYYLFSSLTNPSFPVHTFHKRISILSVLALAGYLNAYFSLRETGFATYLSYRRERRLQAANIAGVALVQGISALILVTRPMTGTHYAILGAIAATALGINIAYSLRVTFSNRIDSEVIEKAYISPALLPSAQLASHLEIRQACREDALALSRLLSAHFAYVYSTLFDSSPRLTRTLLLAMLRSANGNLPNLGLRAFHVACEQGRGEVLGLLKTSHSSPRRVSLILNLLVPGIVFFHLGLVGLVRTWRNWHIMRDMAPCIRSDELYIQYVAVDEPFQKTGVGQHLLEFARELGTSMGKTRLVLDVRETNHRARKFFREQGFHEVEQTRRPSDAILGKGFTIRMEQALAGTHLSESLPTPPGAGNPRGSD